jgi:hypothetical protein
MGDVTLVAVVIWVRITNHFINDAYKHLIKLNSYKDIIKLNSDKDNSGNFINQYNIHNENNKIRLLVKKNLYFSKYDKKLKDILSRIIQI